MSFPFSFVDTSDKGRCLVASRAILKGEVVIEEESYCLVATQRFSEVVCSLCAAICTSATVYKTAPDDPIRYCSEACITRDYAVHRIEIQALNELSSFINIIGLETIRIVVRLAANKKLEVISGGSTVSPTRPTIGRDNKFNHLMTLEAAGRSMTTATLELISSNAEKISLILKKHGFLLSSGQISHIIISIQCNAHKVLNSDGNAVALGLFPMTSMINHSCTPNAVHGFQLIRGELPRLVMHAITDIPIGTEICYSYVQLYQSTMVRKEQLRSAYSFDCMCFRCRENDDDSRNEIETLLLNDSVIDDCDCGQLLRKEVDICISLGNKESGKLLSLNKLLGIFRNSDKSSEIPIGSKVFLHMCVSITSSAADLIDAGSSVDLAQIAFSFGAITMGCIYAFTKIESVEIGRMARCYVKAIEKLMKSNVTFENAKFNIYDCCVTLPLANLATITAYTDDSRPYNFSKFLLYFRNFCQMYYVVGDDILTTARRLLHSNLMTEGSSTSLKI